MQSLRTALKESIIVRILADQKVTFFFLFTVLALEDKLVKYHIEWTQDFQLWTLLKEKLNV